MHKDQIKIIIASHKESDVPDDPVYLPVMAGAALNGSIPEGWSRDDTGDNISLRNREYSELTALYWAWKNLDADIAGLCHYRRFFASLNNATGVKAGHILSGDEIMHLLRVYDVILPNARNYVLETNRSQYTNAHHAADLDLTRQIIAERCPGYLSAYDKRMAMSKGHRFNMMIMRKTELDLYCSWLFDILFELEKRLDISDYKGIDRRVFGLVAERLADVWIDANGLRSTEVDYIFCGNEHLHRKAAAMLIRKTAGALRGINAGRRQKHKSNSICVRDR